MTTFDQMMQCKPVRLTEFKAVVLGISHPYVSEAYQDSSRFMLIRDGFDRGPLIAYRVDGPHGASFFARR